MIKIIKNQNCESGNSYILPFQRPRSNPSIIATKNVFFLQRSGDVHVTSSYVKLRESSRVISRKRCCFPKTFGICVTETFLSVFLTSSLIWCVVSILFLMFTLENCSSIFFFFIYYLFLTMRRKTRLRKSWDWIVKNSN